MFDLINGLPVHPLVVHAVVVLVPLAAIGAVAIAAKPAWRRPYGPLVVAVAAVAAILCPVATSSGEALEKHVGDPGRHAELGDQLIWFVLPLLLLTLALVVLDRRQRRAVKVRTDGDAGATGSTRVATRTESTTGQSTAVKVVAALSVLAALAVSFQVYRVGDSGARAAWGGQVSSTPGGGGTSGESGD